MKAQEYLDSLIEECRVYNDKSMVYRDIYSKLFPDLQGQNEVKTKIKTMNDEELFEYFKASQVMLDVQTIYNKVASFIYFCKYTHVELDLTRLEEMTSLANFIASFVPFNTEFITTSEGEIKEKNNKEFQRKFIDFKKAIGNVIDLV